MNLMIVHFYSHFHACCYSNYAPVSTRILLMKITKARQCYYCGQMRQYLQIFWVVVCWCFVFTPKKLWRPFFFVFCDQPEETFCHLKMVCLYGTKHKKMAVKKGNINFYKAKVNSRICDKRPYSFSHLAPIGWIRTIVWLILTKYELFSIIWNHLCWHMIHDSYCLAGVASIL